MLSKIGEQIKKYVAEHSTREAGAQIVKRNEALLAIVETVGCYPDSQVIDRRQFDVRIGCPHCTENYDCSFCLWSKAARLYTQTPDYEKWKCCQVPFGGVCYDDVNNSNVRWIWVSYAHDAAGISMVTPDKGVLEYRKQYRQVVAFLKGHIAWGKRAYWGTKFNLQFEGVKVCNIVKLNLIYTLNHKKTWM